MIIIDINNSGDGIISASSLSPHWQILSTTLSSAPTFSEQNEQAGDEEGGERGLMLRIEGLGIDTGEEEGLGIVDKKGGSAVLGEEEIQSLLEGFDRKMGVLRKIVGEGWGGITTDVDTGIETENVKAAEVEEM